MLAFPSAPVAAVPAPAAGVLEPRHCTVILVSGAADGGVRATLAFTAALSAATMDQPTLVFLAGDGATWAYEGRTDGVRVPGFPALAALVDAFVAAGGQIGLCTPCDAACNLAADGAAGPPARLRSVRLQGMPSVLTHAVDGSVLTF